MCPVGWVLDDCGSFKQRTCEDYLTNTHRGTSRKTCGMPACVCPEGLVVYKGQCVDPLECHTLIHCILSIMLKYILCVIRASVDALSRDGTDMRGDAQNPKSFQAPRM